MSYRKDAPPADTAKAQRAEPSLAELIAQTPGAQTREQALAHIKRAREQKRHAEKAATVDALPKKTLAKREPLPIIDNPDQHAADFWKRFNAKGEEKRKATQRLKAAPHSGQRQTRPFG